MSQVTEYPYSVGIDVSKQSLDVHLLPDARSWTLPNTDAAHQELVGELKQLPREVKIVLEATGGLERPLVAALAAAAIAVVVINPRQARRFAESLVANPAKTDRADARVLALMACTLPLELRPLPDARQQELAELVSRRRQIVEMLACEKMRLAQATARRVREDVRATISWLEERLRQLDRQLDELVGSAEELRLKSEVLMQEKGVGRTTARILVAVLPELGRLDRRRIASLAGVAPFARDSGSMHAARHVRGGRSEVRAALWMAAFNARRWNPPIRELYERLMNGGKCYKVAMTACMRKLLVILNAQVRRHCRAPLSPCTPTP